MKNVYTVQRGSKSVGFYSGGRPYVIGFSKLTYAKAVQYNMHPEPMDNFQLIPGIQVNSDDCDLCMFPESTLFIPKLKGDALHPMNDAGFHLKTMNEVNFYTMPILNNVGIILPYKLIEEDECEFTFKANVVFKADKQH